MYNGLNITSIQMKNFLSVGNVLQTIMFDNGIMRIVTGEDFDANKQKRSGIGKAQPYYSKVKTPSGWTPIESLGVGDFVCSPDGTTTIVSGVYPQGYKDTAKVTFEDGRKAEACLEHLWKTYTVNGGWEVINTQDIQGKLDKNETISVPIIDDLYENEDKSIMGNIDYYYLIGLYHACGAIHKTGHIVFNTFDTSMYDAIKNVTDNIDGVSLITVDEGYLISDKNGYLEKTLKSYEYRDNILDDEFISQSSSEQRKKILQGIFDIYGYEENNTLVCNFGPDKNFARLVQKLSFSLGGKGKIIKSIVSDSIMNIEEHFTLKLKFKKSNLFFTLIHKKTFSEIHNMSLKVKSIEKTEKQRCVCIKVVSDDELYVTDNYIVTHNTTVPNALSYALYGKPISDIKKSRIPNKTNKKDTYVKVEFEKFGKKYYIERGIKPDIFKFVSIDDSGNENDITEKNDTQGTKADTEKDIRDIIGMSYDLFTMIITVNTLKNSYMKSPLSKQRDIIEEILNIIELTQKAKVLSDVKIKNTKQEIEKEKVRIETNLSNMKRAEDNYAKAISLKEDWDVKQEKKIKAIEKQIEEYQEIDIEEEIKRHENNEKVKEREKEKERLKTEKSSTESLISRGNTRLKKINENLESFSENICPTCQQTIEDDKHKHEEKNLLQEANEYFTVLEDAEKKLKEYDTMLSEYTSEDITYKPTYYKNIKDAYNHQHSIKVTKQYLDEIKNEENPLIENVEITKNNIVESKVDYSTQEKLEKLLEHQLFLQKILTGRDSFVRKRIIDVSIPLLNERMAFYLSRSELHHEIKFESDLTLEITKNGEEYDFDNLSRGEQNWAIIVLNLAMRDLYEQLTFPINILFVDELIDFGMDASGADDAYTILKNISRDNDKSVSLITHREELFEKADEILFTTMENGFSTYEVQRN